jgi:hypothetical protein
MTTPNRGQSGRRGQIFAHPCIQFRVKKRESCESSRPKEKHQSDKSSNALGSMPHQACLSGLEHSISKSYGGRIAFTDPPDVLPLMTLNTLSQPLFPFQTRSKQIWDPQQKRLC